MAGEPWLFGITNLTEGTDLNRNQVCWKDIPVGLLNDPLKRPEQAIGIAAICLAIEWTGGIPKSMEQVSDFIEKNKHIDVEPYKKTIEEQVEAYWAQFNKSSSDWTV